MSKLRKEEFRFKKLERVGAEGAEEDLDMLIASDCFVDTGELELLADPSAARRIVVGRTGSGKSALLLKLRDQEDHVAWIEPERLALQYVANSTIIRQLDDLGVDLDIFYRLLWRHVFAVELIKLKHTVRTEADQKSFFTWIKARLFGDKRKEAAMKYLQEWGDHFWEDTEYRIHEVTQRLESEIADSAQADLEFLSSSIAAVERHVTEERKEIVHRLQAIVNRVQIRQLSEVIDILAQDVFNDEQTSYFIAIDRLDEKWVDDRLRYRLIRALIETVKDFKKVARAKIVVALRQDLLDTVFRETRDSGFQEEKYEPLFLRVRWNQDELMMVVNKRIDRLVRRQYTKRKVSWRDVFPDKVDKQAFPKYIVSRTLYRPRDIIQFVNCCIEAATDRPAVSPRIVQQAELDYSNRRYRSVQDEWISHYPGLLAYSSLLKNRSTAFPLSTITSENLDDVVKGLPLDGASGVISDWARAVYEERMSFESFRRQLAQVFYKVGFVGVRPQRGGQVYWSFRGQGALRAADICVEARLEVAQWFFGCWESTLVARVSWR